MRGDAIDMPHDDADLRPADEEVRGGQNIAEWLGLVSERVATERMKRGQIPGVYKRDRDWILIKYWRGVRERARAATAA